MEAADDYHAGAARGLLTRLAARRAVVAALAALVGAVLGVAAGLTLPAGGPVIKRALPASRGAVLPRIVGAAGTGARAPLVVIDPGHGGFDPGASATGGAREKDVVLALALAVRDRLLALGGVRVAMTREDDSFLPLEQRPALAEALGASAFISIHADSAPVPEARGANIYVLSPRASDREALALARVANARGDDLAQAARMDDVALILVDLMKRETTLGSARLARAVERESHGRMPVHPPFRRAANFAVLRSPEMASALFEAGYLTNPEDAARLADPRQRGAIADALAAAILTHLLVPARD